MVVTPGEVGSPNAFAKERVTGKEGVVSGDEEAHASGRVSWCSDNIDCDRAALYYVTVGEVTVWRWWRNSAQSVDSGVFGSVIGQRDVIFMDGILSRRIGFFEFCDSAHVVKMSMSGEYPANVQALLLDEVLNRVEVASGVYNGGITRGWVIKDGTIHL